MEEDIQSYLERKIYLENRDVLSGVITEMYIEKLTYQDIIKIKLYDKKKNDLCYLFLFRVSLGVDYINYEINKEIEKIRRSRDV